MLEERPCGLCGKKMRAFKDEAVPGVHVDAYRCSNGHVSYPAEVMRHVEALYRAASEERSVLKVGSSLAVPIPAAIAKSFGLRPKEKVLVSADDKAILIRKERKKYLRPGLCEAVKGRPLAAKRKYSLKGLIGVAKGGPKTDATAEIDDVVYGDVDKT